MTSNCASFCVLQGREEVTYAELSLPNSPAYHPGTLRPHQAIRPQEPIIYAQIDPLKSAQCVPVGVHEQQTQTLPGYPLTLPHPSSEVRETTFPWKNLSSSLPLLKESRV